MKRKERKKERRRRRKKSSPHFGAFPSFHFQFSTFPFTIFLLFFSILPPFPFFPCLFFPGRSAEMSRSEVSGELCPPPPTCYATGCKPLIAYRQWDSAIYFYSGIPPFIELPEGRKHVPTFLLTAKQIAWCGVGTSPLQSYFVVWIELCCDLFDVQLSATTTRQLTRFTSIGMHLTKIRDQDRHWHCNTCLEVRIVYTSPLITHSYYILQQAHSLQI